MTYSEMLVSGGSFRDASDNEYIFSENGDMEYREIIVGAALTIAAFESVLGTPGGWLVCIGIALFAFSTILGWEYHGEKAFEYLFGTHRYNMIYRIVFSLIVYVGATTTLEIAWNFSDIANALMAIPNLICLLALSGVIAQELERYQAVIAEEKAAKKAAK
jgi:AGCS family alanine or glycine:cation symporter